MLGVLPEPARTAVATCAFTGVRRGELAGLLRGNFDAKKGSMKITQSVWEGHVTRPKTKKSKASVPIIRTLARMLDAHCVRVGQIEVEAARRRAMQARKLMGSATLRSEKRAALTLVASAEKLVANPPAAGPIFASGERTPLNMNNLLNRQILPALRKAGFKDRFGQAL
jgi:integrase